jgi:DNA repair protein SbcC/Rad50
MRSLELKIEGFTSFRTPQVLDFSNLELFAITGPTGAGKTSILDAMTYALYGHVARFGKDARHNELVSQGQDNLKVSFRFAVRGVEYRVTRTWRQRPKSEETKVVLEVLQNNNWEKLEIKEKAAVKRIESIIGMDFDTFTRVILLPQGKFDEFIKGNKTKRREILIDLAGFKIFEKMRAKAAEEAKRFKQQYDIFSSQRNELELPTDIEVTEKEASIKAITEQLKRLDEEKSKAKEQLDKAQELFEQITRLNTLTSKLGQLSHKSTEIEQLKQTLQQAQAADQIQGAYALVKSARETYKKASANSVSIQKKLQEAEKSFNQQKANKDKVTVEQKQIEPQLKVKEQALTTLKTYDEQKQGYNQELELAISNQKQRKTTLDTTAQTLGDAQTTYNETLKKSKDAEATLQTTSPGGTRLKQLEQVSSLLGAWKILEQQAKTSQNKLTNTTAQRNDAQKIKDGAALKLQEAEALLKQHSAAFEQAETANRNTLQNNHAAALREILHDGDNCPVCNGIYKEDNLHSLQLSSLIDIQPLLEKKQSAAKAYNIAEKALTQAEVKLNNLEDKLKEDSENVASQQKSLADSTQQISTIIESKSWQVEALESELTQIKENDTQYNAALTAQKEASVEVRESKQALDTAQENHTTAQNEYKLATEQVKLKQEQLQIINKKINGISEGKSYSVLEKELEKQQKDLQDKIKTANEAYQTSERILIQRQTEEKEASIATSEALQERDNQDTQWQVALVSAGFTEPEYLNAVTEAKQQNLWQQQIDDYNTQKVTLTTQIQEVKAQIGARTIEESTLTTLKTNQQTAEQKHQHANDELTSLKVWMQSLASKREQAAKLEQEIQNVKKQAETYTTLATKLKGDEFQSYILEHIETELVTRATNVLQDLTQSRYSLTIKDGDYHVKDDWNGGEVRRVQTLSGGETFATSLSMALALSEKLSMGAELGSLFLDEGFGTLDSETLDTVYSILQSLQQRDKLIGVITHVKALGELLTQVRVYKAPSGSEIEIEF